MFVSPIISTKIYQLYNTKKGGKEKGIPHGNVKILQIFLWAHCQYHKTFTPRYF